MPFDPLGFLFPKSNIPKGGYGYTTTETVEILPPTVCPLKDDGYYDIPSSTGLDGNHDYYLYVDGQEFKYAYDPRSGSGWIRTDNTDRRFNSIYENIYPDQIVPVPETVTASIKRVSKIDHLIDPKYLTIKIDLLEYGIDVFGMFFAGETQATFDRFEDLFALVNANKDSDITFVLRSGDGSLIVETKASKAMSGYGSVANLSSYVPLYNGTAYAVGLFVTSNGRVLLSAKEM